MASQNEEQKVTLESVRMNPHYPEVKDVSPNEVYQKNASLLLVDVRTPEELSGELGHIEGVRHIPMDQIGGRLSELPQDQTVVFVCRSGNRSGTVAAFATDQGYDAYNMEGGMLKWNELNLPTVKA